MKTVLVCYYRECNTATFDKICLYRSTDIYDLTGEEENDSSVYDENGNLISYTDDEGVLYEYTYYTLSDGSFVTKTETITETKTVNGAQTTKVTVYEYNTEEVLIKETTPDNKVYNYTYDDNGNLISRLTTGGVGDRYTYNTNGDILTENFEDGTVNIYTYSAYDKLTRQTTTKDGKTLAYNYDAEGNLTKVEHNGFEYNYEYDAFGNTTGVKVGNQNLINYTYQPDKSKISSEVYGNGSQINYTYTPYGQVYTMNSVGLGTVTTKYDALGNIIYENDEPAEIKTYYEYDSDGRPAGEIVTTSAVGITGNNFLYSSFNVFDNDGNITKNSLKTQSTLTTNYSYVDGLPSQTQITSSRKVNFTYDEDEDLLTRTLTTNIPVVETFAYDEKDFISTHTFSHGTDADIVYAYSYDEKGNILEIKKNNVVQQSYVYDANSQLIRENNFDLNKTIVYTYDNGGNIVSKTEYAYTTGTPTTPTDTINYTYDTAWKDKLTSYDGQSISYDAIGNPINYMGATMTWFARQMQSYSKGNTSITYKYDGDGLRTQKVVNGVEHNYYYVDGQLRYEKYGDSYEIYYNYDADGRPCRAYKKDLVTGTNYSYYLITNTRGDIIETRDGNGNVNAKFVYDSWGKLISVTDGNGNALSTDSFAYQISLKYRSYYYDRDVEMYYLQSRYYDAEVGRFINCDDVNYIGVTELELSYNAFAYCENNSVNRCDITGHMFNWLVNMVNNIENIILTCYVYKFLSTLLNSESFEPAGKARKYSTGLYKVNIKYMPNKNKKTKKQFTLILGGYNAWKNNSSVYNSESRTYMDHYGQSINDESVKLGTRQDVDIIYIQNMTAALAITLVFYGIKSSYYQKVYNAVWGVGGLDPSLSLGYYAYKITGDRTYNGSYAYSIVLDKVVNLKI